MPEPSGGSLAEKSLTWDTRTESHHGGRNHLVVPLPVSLTQGRRGALRDGVPDRLQYTTLPTLFSSVVQVGTHPQFWNQ